MKRMFMLLTIAVVCASMAFAQGQSTQTSDPSSGAGDSTIQGCLSGSEGNYMLTVDSSGTMYKLSGKESKLKEHVGHEVAVTGQMSTGEGATGSQQDQGQSTSSTGSGSVIQVSEVKMISKHCGSGTGAPQRQ